MEVSYKSEDPVDERRGTCSPVFHVTTGRLGGLRLVGELDVGSAAALRAALADVDGDIWLDCSGLTFIDCFGLRVLLETQRACETAGVHLILVAPSRCMTRLLDLAGLDGSFDVRDGSDP